MSKKGSNESLSRAAGGKSVTMDDINYLLHLETKLRFKEESENLKRQVDEITRKYEEAKAEYSHYYELYVECYKTGMTSAVLNMENSLSEDQLKRAKSDLEKITKSVKNDKSVAQLDPEILEQFQLSVSSIKNADQTKDIQKEMNEQKAAINSIQNLTKTVQSKLELATTQGLDYFVELIQSQQLDNIASESHIDSTLEE